MTPEQKSHQTNIKTVTKGKNQKTSKIQKITEPKKKVPIFQETEIHSSVRLTEE